MTTEVWKPDGRPLTAEVLALTPADATIHLRLHHGDRYPRTACAAGLGQVWTGDITQVTCTPCIATQEP